MNLIVRNKLKSKINYRSGFIQNPNMLAYAFNQKKQRENGSDTEIRPFSETINQNIVGYEITICLPAVLLRAG
ncbi:hypothetical protein CTE07_15050 [Chitinophaga terrae (ex Kim and Jung 2007)]|nr:hypothetical protein CTE07_15050 [Chitinophaga terrae (ex Kim and Jung 2007)]